MDLTTSVQKLKEEIYYGSEALQSLSWAIQIAKDKNKAIQPEVGTFDLLS